MSESRRNPTRFGPSSTTPPALDAPLDRRPLESDAPVSGARPLATSAPARVSAALNFARGAPGIPEHNPFSALSDETTVEVDTTALALVLARSSEETLEATRTYQIPEELLAIARGDDNADDAPALPIELRRPGRSSRPAPTRNAHSHGLVTLAHMLVIAWAIALAYWMARLVQG